MRKETFLRGKSSRVDFSLPKIVKVVGQALPDNDKPGYFKKSAYTLAEVILVIGIIGIIAALTIPQLIQKSNNKDLVSAFLKSNNVLANAYKNAKAIDNIHKLGGEDFKQTFKKYVKTVDCEEHDMCLQDGMFVDFECDETSCTELTVDTNSDKKPNQAGKDQFKFYITPDRIIPQGESEQCSGYDCGMYTLTYHKIFDGLITDCVSYEAGKCKTCDNGYHLSNNSCSAIDMPTCVTFSGEDCIECREGYHVLGGACERGYIANCVNVDEQECTQCKLGYYVNLSDKTCNQATKVTLNNGNDVYVSDITPPEDLYYIGVYTDWGYAYNFYNGAVDICNKKGMRLPTITELNNIYDVREQIDFDFANSGQFFADATGYTTCMYRGQWVGQYHCTASKNFVTGYSNDYSYTTDQQGSQDSSSSGHYVMCVNKN